VAEIARHLARAAGRGYSVVVLLLCWEIISRSGLVSPRLVPNLEQIGVELWRLAASGDLLFHSSITLERVFLGFGAAIAGGIALGTVMARSQWCEALFEPLFTFSYPIPRITLYPLFVFAFGFGDLSKILLVFLECLYPVTIQTFYGMRSADRVMVWAARNMGASERQLFWRVLAPSAAPAIFAGIRIALPVAFILTIVTEIIGESRGLGYLIAFSSASYEYGRAMAALFTTGVLGFVFDRVLIALQRRVIHWQTTVPSLTP